MKNNKIFDLQYNIYIFLKMQKLFLEIQTIMFLLKSYLKNIKNYTYF